jgi:hypothetical protein
VAKYQFCIRSVFGRRRILVFLVVHLFFSIFLFKISYRRLINTLFLKIYEHLSTYSFKHNYLQGRTGHIPRWEFSHGASRERGPLRQSAFPPPISWPFFSQISPDLCQKYSFCPSYFLFSDLFSSWFSVFLVAPKNRLQMFVQSEEAPICSLDSSLYFQTHVVRWCHPRYTNSLTTSKCLSPIATLCPTSRIVVSFRAAIIYFVFCSFIFNPTLAVSPSNAK